MVELGLPAPPVLWRDAVLSTGLAGGRARCGLCPHLCELDPDETGPCAVRRNSGGRVVSATFAVTAVHLDTVERKPLYHFRPGTKVLTLAAPGCTFRCNYCVNHRLSQYGRGSELPWSGREADPGALVARAQAEHAALGLSYSEPGLSLELTLALAELAAPAGIPLVWKTNGFLTPAAVDAVAPYLAAVTVDIKAADDRSHERLTGAPLRPVLDAIERFRAHGTWVEVATPLVPGAADSPAALERIARYLASVDPLLPWHLLRFTPDFRMRRHQPTSPSALQAAAGIGAAAGLAHVYVERALGERARNTACRGCGTTVIRRDVWTTTSWAPECPNCRLAVPGRWS
ncbi:radical SAM protein [Saccharothrix sp. MB29]|nr:radical SAM protein [Saccharothrix sp. MB29]